MPVGNAGWNFKDDHDGLSGVHTSEPLLNPTGKPGALFLFILVQESKGC